MDLAGWSLTIKADTAVTLQGLQQERVILYGTPGENSIVEELVGKFPYGIRNDSAVVNQAVVYDTLLSLIQAIDNPYFTNGTLFWIAPLSDRAIPQLLPYEGSWVLTRGVDVITSGTWEVKDDDVRTVVKQVTSGK